MSASGFQNTAIAKVTEVFQRRSIDVSFHEAELGQGFLEAAFQFQGQLHVVELGGDFIQMEQGESLFEAHSWRSRQPREAMIEEFARRLDRYLGGGEWDD